MLNDHSLNDGWLISRLLTRAAFFKLVRAHRMQSLVLALRGHR